MGLIAKSVFERSLSLKSNFLSVENTLTKLSGKSGQGL